MQGDCSIEYRTVLNATLKGPGARKNIGMLPYSVNEVAIHRQGASVLGIRVSVNGETLPTYWADGLIVSTSSGSMLSFILNSREKTRFSVITSTSA